MVSAVAITLSGGSECVKVVLLDRLVMLMRKVWTVLIREMMSIWLWALLVVIMWAVV